MTLISRTLLRSSAIGLLVLAPALAAAQKPQTRSGFGISFGIGGGTVGTTCDNCTDERAGGAVAYLRIGGHPRPNLFLAGESNAWVNDDEGVDESLSFVTFVAHWYPSTNGGVYLRGGLGVSIYQSRLGTTEFESSTGALTFGIGYDIRVGRNFSLTPFAHAFGTGEGEMLINGDPSGARFSNNHVQVGLGFTWH